MPYLHNAGVSHVSYMCHKIVTEMSQDCPAVTSVTRCRRRVSPDVTEMSRPSHIFVTRCHKLRNNCHTSHAVSQSVNTSVDVDKLTYGPCAGGSEGSTRWRQVNGDGRSPRVRVCGAVSVLSIPDRGGLLSFLQAPPRKFLRRACTVVT